MGKKQKKKPQGGKEKPKQEENETESLSPEEKETPLPVSETLPDKLEKLIIDKKSTPDPKPVQNEEDDQPPKDLPPQAADVEPEKRKDTGKSKSPPLLQFGGTSGGQRLNTELTIPRRGGPGKVGTCQCPEQVKRSKQCHCKILVHANHLPLKIDPKLRINHYDVDIQTPFKRTNKKSDEPLFQRAFKKLCEENKTVFTRICAFDGLKNIYSPKPLNYKGNSWKNEVTVPENDFNDREAKLVFTIQLCRAEIDIAGAVKAFIGGQVQNAYAETQVLNIILSQVARRKWTTVGRNYFPESSQPGRTVDLPGGKCVWFGLFQSVNIGWKPMLNVDVANKPAVKGGHMLDYMSVVLASPGRGRDYPPQRIDFTQNGGKNWEPRYHLGKLERDLKGLKIRYNRPDGQKREWRCNKIMDPAATLKFEHEGKIMTVADYFKIAYNYTLKFPYLPCLHLGSPQKQFWLPVELCEMKTQAMPQSKKLGEDETAQMIRATAVNPQERKQRIESSLRDISNTFKDDEYAREFGLSVESVMEKIQARVYDPPTLQYEDIQKKVKVPFDIPKPGGKWDMTRGPRGIKLGFNDNKHLNNWAILNMARTRPNDVENFVNALFKEGENIGYNVDFPKVTATADPNNMNAVCREFQKLCQMKVDMILLITSARNASIYNGLKYEGDVINKVSTQFVQQKNIGNDRFPPKPATLHNILLKINSKLGGTNQVLHSQNIPNILQKPAMIMGADVTHPASDFKETKPSIAAVVASMDPKASQYKCEILLQSSLQNEEVISRMEEVTKKLLLEFLRRNKRKPARIIFYRDGVSEGQFLIVLNQELAAIRRACSALEEDYKPAITYLTAQKRHKTRLFPVNPRDGVGKNGNVPPGTAVDHTITHPTEFSFFLASHEGIQGTTKPTSYHLLWDDANMNSDEIIRMTYYLCHIYARCERSVSYPAPTYYAHLAAFRARVHHDALLESNQANRENTAKLEENMNMSNYFM